MGGAMRHVLAVVLLGSLTGLAGGSLAGCGDKNRAAVDAGPDAPMECLTEGVYRCNGSSYQACTGGLWVTETDCPAGCTDALGCVECNPGERYCEDDGNVWQCALNGTPEALVETCSGVNTCSGGGCVDACATAASNKSYIGCEYWAADLDNATEVLGLGSTVTPCAQIYGSGVTQTRDVCFRSQGANSSVAGLCDPPNDTCPTGFTCTSRLVCVLDAQQSPFAIVVSNPQARDVDVTVTGPGGELITQTVAAGQVAPILPQASNAIPDQSIDGSVMGRKAYKVTSTLPIVAYQFNPLDNVNVFSNDASLLLPRTAYDTSYYAMSWPTLDRRANAPGAHRYHGYITVVAWTDGTQIAVTPTAAVQASATQPAIAAGVTTMFTLDAFEVLQLQASGAGDLTGTTVTSPNNTTFAMFAGHEAASFGETTPPSSATPNGPCCADHLEEMMFPASTWGKSFAIARSQQRTNEGDVIRVLAQRPGTTVTFTPAPVSGTCGTLNAGQFCEVKVAGDTAIVASEPVLVGQYLQSSIWSNNANTMSVGNGDPSLAIAVPTEQFRADYTILVPAAYDQSYISIATGMTGGVSVDGTPLTLAAFPGGGPYRGARLPVAAGQHTITCPDTCSVLVYGYSARGVSYMFAGGLDLKQIVIQ